MHRRRRLRAGDRSSPHRQGRQKSNARVEVGFRPGHHLVPGSAVAWIAGFRNYDDLAREILASILIGRQRSSVEDLEFSIRQLVEIAERALSPGINDPFTAMAVIDRLSLSLVAIMRHGPAPSAWRSDDGKVRVTGSASTFEGLVDIAFAQIRQRAADTPAVMIRLADDLGQLINVANPALRNALLRQLELTRQAGRSGIAWAADRKAFERRIKRAKRSK
ncbi:MAG: DUF2254 family protein [Pseudolabrys sp.]